MRIYFYNLVVLCFMFNQNPDTKVSKFTLKLNFDFFNTTSTTGMPQDLFVSFLMYNN